MPTDIIGLPGIHTEPSLDPRNIFTTYNSADCVPSSIILSGAAARDLGSGSSDLLRAGLLLGKITASGKYANSILGLTTVAYASGTTLTLPAAIVTEIQRRIGASGTFTITGPATTGGTVNSETVTYSAIASSTTLTITALNNAYVVGSLIQPADGSQLIKTILAEEYGLCVVDTGGNNIDQPLPRFLRGGDLLATAIVNLTEGDAAVQAWLKTQLKAAGLFTFDNDR